MPVAHGRKMPKFYDTSVLALNEARRLDVSRYQLNATWFAIEWSHPDGSTVVGNKFWGKVRPCISGALYCKPCRKDIIYGSRGKKSLDDHIDSVKHMQNMMTYMDKIKKEIVEPESNSESDTDDNGSHVMSAEPHHHHDAESETTSANLNHFFAPLTPASTSSETVESVTASTSGFVPTKPTRTSTAGDVEYHWAMTMIADVKNIQNQAKRRRIMHDLQSRLLDEVENATTDLPSAAAGTCGSNQSDLVTKGHNDAPLPVDVKLDLQSEETEPISYQENPNTQRNSPLTMPRHPTSIVLTNLIGVKHQPLSITKRNNKIYVGLENPSQIVEINEDRKYKKQQVLTLVDGIVSSLQVYNDEIYAHVAKLLYHRVMVFDLSGNFLRCWSHTGNSHHYTMLRVVDDMVVIPCDERGSLYVYSLKGELIKEIKCPITANSWKSMAVLGDTSVIVCDWGDNGDVVFRVDLDHGEVVWTTTEVASPNSVVCYNDYVLVATHDKDTKIWVLDVESGKRLNQITGMIEKMDYNTDMFIATDQKLADSVIADTLMVAKYRGRSIHNYVIEWENGR